MMDAVILAGGVDTGEIKAATGIEHRCLLEVAGRTIIQLEVAALRGASEVGSIALVGPPPVQAAAPEGGVDFRVEAASSFVENIVRGVEATSGAEQVLVITGDLPFLTAEAINDFVRQSALSRADVTYSIIPKESCERRFPGGHRTYARLREGTYTGGNVVVLSREFVRTRRDLIESLYSSRKNVVKLAAILGLPFLLGLLTHRLTIPKLEARASRIVGAKVSAIVTSYAEIGFDVDKMDDLNLARRVADSR